MHLWIKIMKNRIKRILLYILGYIITYIIGFLCLCSIYYYPYNNIVYSLMSPVLYFWKYTGNMGVLFLRFICIVCGNLGILIIYYIVSNKK